MKLKEILLMSEQKLLQQVKEGKYKQKILCPTFLYSFIYLDKIESKDQLNCNRPRLHCCIGELDVKYVFPLETRSFKHNIDP